MIIIKDLERQINIHPLIIYFMLPQEEKEKYEWAIKRLNGYRSFTRGLFKFEIISNLGKYNTDLKIELTNSLKDYNMLVRLVDDKDGNYYYALHKVDFEQEPDQIDQSIQDFVKGVCIEDLKLLSEREHFYGSPEAYDNIISTFNRAIWLPKTKYHVWDRLTNDYPALIKSQVYETYQDYSRVSMARERMAEPPESVIRKIEMADLGLTGEQTKRVARFIWTMFETEYNIPDKKTSDEIATGIVDSSSSSIRRDYIRRFPPKTEPTIIVEIKKVTARILKGGKKKQAFGVEFKINGGEGLPVHFGSKDQALLYIYTLLRCKIGVPLFIHELRNNNRGRNSHFKKERSKYWLEAVYNAIYKDFDFNTWLEKIQPDGRPLNQAKSQSTKLIEKILSNNPDSIYYSIINTQEDINGDTYYELKLKPDNIIIPKDMVFLVDDFHKIIDSGSHSNDNYRQME